MGNISPLDAPVMPRKSPHHLEACHLKNRLGNEPRVSPGQPLSLQTHLVLPLPFLAPFLVSVTLLSLFPHKGETLHDGEPK